MKFLNKENNTIVEVKSEYMTNNFRKFPSKFKEIVEETQPTEEEIPIVEETQPTEEEISEIKPRSRRIKNTIE